MQKCTYIQHKIRIMLSVTIIWVLRYSSQVEFSYNTRQCFRGYSSCTDPLKVTVYVYKILLQSVEIRENMST